LVLHPVRMRIVMALAGRRLSPGELALELGDVPSATLYRHINRLADGGVLEVVEERPVRNTLERIYTLKPGAAYGSQAEYSHLSQEEKLRYFVSYLLSLLDDFARYLNQPEDGSTVGPVGFQKFPLYLTPGEFAGLVQRLNAAILPQADNLPSPERQPVVMGFITIPAPVRAVDQPDQESENDDK
jgi:DNA-binding transcriptional ArsR family regulator